MQKPPAWFWQAPEVLDLLLYYAGSDATRAQQVLGGVNEDGVSAIWAARGGYGTARILEGIQDEIIPALEAHPRWLIGYSDLTALHALWNRAGVQSLHGPMGSDIQSFSASARQTTFNILSHAITQVTYAGSIRFPGASVAGKLLGGNLSVLASMVGAGYLPSYDGAILFIEDTGEAAYSWDRMLTQLLRSPDFVGIVGITIGQMVGADTTSYTALQLLDLTLEPLGLPVITGIPVGHSTSTAMPLVLGSDAIIDIQNAQLITTF